MPTVFRATYRITKDQFKAVKREAKKNKVSQSEVIRALINSNL